MPEYQQTESAARRLLQDWWSEMGVAAETPLSALPSNPPPLPAQPPANASMEEEAEQHSSANAPSAAQTLEELEQALKNISGFALKSGARNTVFARGNPQSGLMLIGEAPGADEDRQGRPFVGRAGQLLDKMFAAIGRDRESGLYITNLLPWRPPANRDPTPDEISFCLPFLLRHIELAKPKLLVTAGRFATHTLLGTSQPMTRMRGQKHPWQHQESLPVPCIPIMHPAYLLRRPQDKARAWRDMLAIARAAREAGLDNR